MHFRPPRCAHADCPSRKGTSFQWRRRGTYTRKCDGQVVPRFQCLACSRGFSRQTFRLDFRLRKTELHFGLFDLLISKVTHRQSARLLGCNRKTVHHRLKLLAAHTRAYQDQLLERAKAKGGLPGSFQFDELETFEHDRRLCPVTMPVLIETKSYFVVDVAVGTLPARGKLAPRHKERKEARVAAEGKRRNGSRAAVESCIRKLAKVLPDEKRVVIATDHKTSYGAILRNELGARVTHVQHSSTAQRSFNNPLFPINHTLAMLRDGVSRLVRRNWGASKKREWLARHAWVWIAYRNYVRSITNHAKKTSSAMALGLVPDLLTSADLFTWRLSGMTT